MGSRDDAGPLLFVYLFWRDFKKKFFFIFYFGRVGRGFLTFVRYKLARLHIFIYQKISAYFIAVLKGAAGRD